MLLDYLVAELERRKGDVFYLFDERCRGDYMFVPDERKTFIKAGLLNRHRFYKHNARRFDSVLCFGNLAPTMRLKNSRVYTYFHQLFFVSGVKADNPKARLMYALKRMAVRILNKNTDKIIVQSQYVKDEFCKTYRFPAEDVLVLPFYNIPHGRSDAVKSKPKGFVYVSGGNYHKNHARLLSAWDILAADRHNPELGLTIDEASYPELVREIERLKAKGVNVVNYGFTDPYKLYEQYGYLIFPSLYETIGLGQIEAIERGCRVLASDLPHTHAVISPSLLFDPLSDASIAEAVVKALESEDVPPSKIKIRNNIDELIRLIL